MLYALCTMREVGEAWVPRRATLWLSLTRCYAVKATAVASRRLSQYDTCHKLVPVSTSSVTSVTLFFSLVRVKVRYSFHLLHEL